MKIPKKSTMLAAASIAIGLGLTGAGLIHAQTSSMSTTNPMNNLVTAIAQKFNLNSADVQQVFDDQHQQMEAQRQEEYKTRLAQLVKDGKLTQEQVDKIVAKQAEIQTQLETNKDKFSSMTETERHSAMETEHTALQKWATDNNIPMQYLMFGMTRGHGGPGGPGFGHHFEQKLDDTSTTK